MVKGSDGLANSTIAIVTITVTPVNDAPSVDVAATTSGIEGTPIGVSASFSDIDGDAVSIHWSVTAVSGVDPGGSCAIANSLASATTITCSDDGQFAATATVSDGHGGAASATTKVVASNANPVVAITGLLTGQVQPGSEVAVTASLSDPGTNDTQTCTFEWGDATSSPGTLTGSTCSARHAYSASGAKTVTIISVDDDAGRGSANATIQVSTAPPTGKDCVRGEDYWLDHSNPRNKSYNTAWDVVGGPAQPFFISRLSWRSALDKDPNNNAYWILAGDYIVTRLNIAAGANPSPVVQAALTRAIGLFVKATPAKYMHDKTLLQIALVLEDFNGGQAGPRRCGDDHQPRYRCKFIIWF